MKTYLFCFLLIASCTGKQRLRHDGQTAAHTQYGQEWRVHQQQRDSLHEILKSHYGQTIDLLTIYPTDTFTIHPDGSFSGTAGQIHHLRIHTQRADSSTRLAHRHQQRTDTLTADISEQIYTIHRYSETRKKSPFRNWVVLIGVAVLLLLSWLGLKILWK